MKTKFNLVALLFLAMTLQLAYAQEKPKLVTLSQTKGKFEQKDLKLAAGTYVFEIENKNVGKDVGFYLHKKGEEASVTGSDKAGLIPNNQKRKTETVTLTKGEYVYSCPLNPTKDYTLIVE